MVEEHIFKKVRHKGPNPFQRCVTARRKKHSVLPCPVKYPFLQAAYHIISRLQKLRKLSRTIIHFDRPSNVFDLISLVNSGQYHCLSETIWTNYPDEYSIFLFQTESDERWHISFGRTLNPVLVRCACIFKNHELLENLGNVLLRNAKRFIFLELVKNVRLGLRVHSFPNFIIKIKISIPSIEAAFCQAFIQFNRRAFNLNLMRSNHLVNLIFRNTIISDFRIVFA